MKDKQAGIFYTMRKNMRRRRQNKHSWLQWTGSVILAIGLLIVLFIPISYQLGWRFNIINGISMEPVFHAGDLVVTRPVPSQDITIGDVITFRVETAGTESYVCHRVIAIQEDAEGLLFQTQGDNNDDPDSDLLRPEDIMGKQVIYLPGVGKISDYYRTQIRLLNWKIMAGPLFISLVVIGIISSELSTLYDWIFNRHIIECKERRKKRRHR